VTVSNALQHDAPAWNGRIPHADFRAALHTGPGEDDVPAVAIVVDEETHPARFVGWTPPLYVRRRMYRFESSSGVDPMTSYVFADGELVPYIEWRASDASIAPVEVPKTLLREGGELSPAAEDLRRRAEAPEPASSAWTNAPDEVVAAHASEIAVELMLKHDERDVGKVVRVSMYERVVWYRLQVDGVTDSYVALYHKALKEWIVFRAPKPGLMLDACSKPFSAAVVSAEALAEARKRERALIRAEEKRERELACRSPGKAVPTGTPAEMILAGVLEPDFDAGLRLLVKAHPAIAERDVPACGCGNFPEGWKVRLHHHLRHLYGHGKTAAELAAAVEGNA
jgi:hypothetical protein